MVLHCRLIQTATLSIPSPQASVMSNLTSNNHTEVQCERVEVLKAVAGIRRNGNCYACKHLASLLSCLCPFNHWLLSATRKERYVSGSNELPKERELLQDRGTKQDSKTHITPLQLRCTDLQPTVSQENIMSLDRICPASGAHTWPVLKLPP